MSFQLKNLTGLIEKQKEPLQGFLSKKRPEVLGSSDRTLEGALSLIYKTFGFKHVVVNFNSFVFFIL